jgi:hypothetical protein
MKFKEFLLLAGVYAVIYIISSLLFVLLFSAPFDKLIDVFFYRGIALLLLSGLFAAGLSFLVKRFWLKRLMTVRDILLIFTIFCSVNMVFFTHVPVTADRSVSIFVLGSMADDPERVFTEQDIENFFISRYVRDYGAFKQRFHEQLVTGTIQAADGGYVISGRGKALMKMYDFIADCFHIDKKLIHPYDAE